MEIEQADMSRNRIVLLTRTTEGLQSIAEIETIHMCDDDGIWIFVGQLIICRSIPHKCGIHPSGIWCVISLS